MKFSYASGARPLEGYTIKRGIGVGGFGEVYFALTDAGKEVALKRVLRHADIEVRGTSQVINLKHPHLVDLYDVKGDDHGNAWIVMEYVAGESLKDALRRHPRGLPLSEVKAWFVGAAEGVAHLNENGVVHRDLKPANLFLDDDVVKIGDYGLSKYMASSPAGGQTENVGTVLYMAPEVGKGDYGRQIDVYAMGVVLYEMLTGQTPFDGETTQEIIYKHLTEMPDLDRAPAAFRPVLARALAKDPQRRYRTMREMLSAFEEACASEPSLVAAEALASAAASAPGVVTAGGSNRPAELVITADSVAAEAGVAVWNAPSADNPFPPPASVSVAAAPRVEYVPRGRNNPPVRVPPGASRAGDGVLYIGDESTDNEIVLGEVRDAHTGQPVVLAQPVAPAQHVGGAPPAGAWHGAAASRPAQRWSQPLPAPNYLAHNHAGAALAAADPRDGWNGWWRHSAVGAPVKVFLVVGFLVAALFQPYLVIPLGLIVGGVYLIVTLVGAALADTSNQAPTAAARARSAAAAHTQRRREALRRSLAQRSPRERCADWTSALLASAGASAVLGLVLTLLAGQTLDGSVAAWSFYAWFTLTVACGAWLVLSVAKTWEGKSSPRDVIRRRFVMLGLGLALGAASWLLSQALLVEVVDKNMLARPWDRSWLPASFHGAGGAPLLPVYLLYFGGLFALPAWWRQADPLRASRVGLLAAASCVLWAWALDVLCFFPQPWGFMAAGAISLAVQVAAPWLPHQDAPESRSSLQEA